NDVWLSEGFATWLSQKVMDLEQPRDRTHLGAIAARERIMRADSLRARAVRTPVDSREGSIEIYNRFVYDKAAAVLMMVEQWLGESRFQTGVRAYLKAHPFGNATAEDLSRELKEASGIDSWPVLHSLLDVGGAPTLHAEVECKKENAVLQVSQ